MAWSFNPFTGNLDLVGGGAVVFEGEVETFADLPETIGDPAVGASFLVRSSTGVWLVNRRQAGIWIRRNNTGVRATDWEYGGDYPVNSVNGQTGNVSLTAADVGAVVPGQGGLGGEGTRIAYVNDDGGLEQVTNATSSQTLGELRDSLGLGTAATQDSTAFDPSKHTIVTSAQTLTNGAKVAADTTAGAFTLTLPATPANGDTVSILDYAGTFDTNNLTIARNGSNIESLAENMDCNIEDAAFSLVYVGSTVGWKVVPYFGNKTNFASPDPIGSSVANTGRFTTLTAGNGTITASAPVLDLSQTWNNAAVTFTGLRFNVTNTASAAASKAIDFQIGGTSVLETSPVGLTTIRRLGAITFANALEVRRDSTLLFNVRDDGAVSGISLNAAGGGTINAPALTMAINQFRGGSNCEYAWTSVANNAYGSGADLRLARDAAATLAQRDGTNPQTFRLYNTFTDASNHERLSLRWASNVAIIGTEKAGTGSARALEFQTDGTSRWQITTAGLLTTVSAPADGGGFLLSNGWINYRAGTTNHWAIVSGDITQRATGNFQWSGQSDASNFSGDWLRLSRSAGGSLLLSAGTSTEHRLQFGGTTSSFPALKRSSATLQVRLADDSGFATIDGLHQLEGTAPATSGATGTAGDIRYDADYIYVCTAANTWKRVAIATW